MKTAAIIVVILAIIGGGAVALTHKSKDNSSTQSTAAVTKPSSAQNSTSSKSSQNTITYSNNGFSPATLTVTSGTKITIKNNASIPLQFDSDPHPEHTDDPELNVGSISPGSSATVTVTQTGSHGYHNHLNASDTGTIIVE